MNCRKARELIPLGSGGDLEREEMDALREHLMLCPECGRVWKRFCEDRERIALLKGFAISADVGEELSRRQRIAMRPPVVGVWLKLSAAACVAFAATLLIFHLFVGGPAEQAPPTPATGLDQPREVVVEVVGRAYEDASIKTNERTRSVPFLKCRVLEAAENATLDF